MPKFTTQQPVNMLDTGAFFEEPPKAGKATKDTFELTDGNQTLALHGKGFKYADGKLVSGTVNGLELSEDGKVALEFSGAKLKAKALYTLINATDAQQATAYIFSSNDTITGSSGDDVLHGFGGKDVLIGGDGNDELIGGAGKDVLTGGNGNDIFRLQGGKANVDKVTDFQHGSDKLFLDPLDFLQYAHEADLADNLVIGKKALDANDFLIFDPSKGALYYDADGNGHGKAVQIATLTGVKTLDASDFTGNFGEVQLPF